MFNFSPVFHGLAIDLILAFNKVKVKGDNGKFAIKGEQCICILHLLKKTEDRLRLKESSETVFELQ
jgi:hypothetical protein